MSPAALALAVVRAVMWLAVTPLVLLVRSQRTLERTTAMFQFCGDFLSIWPFQFGAIARTSFYRRTLASCGTNFRTKFGVVFVHPGTRIGNDVRFGRFTSVGLSDVEDDVMVAHFCSIMSGRRHHRTDLTDTPMRAQDGQATRIRIGAGSWIGANAIVMADIGKGVVVGAGAVVVKPVPDYAVVVGNPGRIVRFRNDPAGDRSIDGGDAAAGRVARMEPGSDLVGVAGQAAG